MRSCPGQAKLRSLCETAYAALRQSCILKETDEKEKSQ